LVLTFDEAVSHHDPAVSDKSNTTLFNRQKQLLRFGGVGTLASEDRMAKIAVQHAVPEDLYEIMADMPFAEFAAAALLKTFIQCYGGDTGSGLFSGVERYTFLETRCRQAAIPVATLRAWWARLCDLLKVPLHYEKDDVVLLDLLSLPLGTQGAALKLLAAETHSLIPVARLWTEIIKNANPRYAEKSGRAALVTPWHTLTFTAAQSNEGAARIVEMPAISANSIRHSLVREPGFLHLCWKLGISADIPGKAALPPMVESLFVNGGNIEGAQPANAHQMAYAMREKYPLLDLLGGGAGTFWLRDGALSVHAWLVCQENADVIPFDLPTKRTSIFDMIDGVTITRRETPQGVGQMITNFETLLAGAQCYIELDVAPQTFERTRGALLAAVEFALSDAPQMGGQAARGFGRFHGEWLTGQEDHARLISEYEDYLDMARAELVSGLMDGTLCTPGVHL
jgi:hypothetical protein